MTTKLMCSGKLEKSEVDCCPMSRGLGFFPRAIGKGRAVLESPFVDHVETVDEVERAKFCLAAAERGFFVGDFNPCNFGIFNGRVVCIDGGSVDEIEKADKFYVKGSIGAWRCIVRDSLKSSATNNPI